MNSDYAEGMHFIRAFHPMVTSLNFAARMVFLLGTLAIACRCSAQTGDESTLDTDGKQTSNWQFGVVIEAVGGPCTNLFATIPVPIDWPEQKVRVVQQDVTRQTSELQFRDLDQGARQMLISVPRLRGGQQTQVLLTYEIDRYPLAAPVDPSELVIPKRPPSDMKVYLGASPYIQSRHRVIRELRRELLDPSLSAWDQVERFYDEVRSRVSYMNGPLKGALAALRDGTGDCEELTSLFIALCRSHGVPARTVWVPDHCYPEFYLEDPDGVGHWYPCQAAGTRAFGSIPELRPILQKGDNFKVPERKERQRYVAEYLTGSARKGSGDPKVEFVRRRITEPQPTRGI